jgi:hypothetical protein
MITMDIITTIAADGKKHATRIPTPRNMAAIAVALGRIFMPQHPRLADITRSGGKKLPPFILYEHV